MKTAIALLTPLALACRMVAAQAVYEESAPVVAYRHPPGRGSSFELAERAPCGGWALGGRTEYPLSGGQVAIELGRDANGLQFAYSTDNDVSASSTFTNIGQSFSLALSGSRCLSAPDFAAAGLNAGQNITLQLYWTAGPNRDRAQTCADIILVDANTPGALNYTCTNTVESTTTMRLSASNPELYAIRSASEKAFIAQFNEKASGLSLAGAGGIGAGVALATVALVLLAGFLTGAVSFGSRKRNGYSDEKPTGLGRAKSSSSSL